MSVSLPARATQVSLLLITVLGSSEICGKELPSLREATKKLQASVVTVRVIHGRQPIPVRVQKQPAKPETSNKSATATRVTVCSGICLGKGLIVTSLDIDANSSIRITYPGGAQSTAQLRVIDEYSGLLLLQTKSTARAGLPLAATLPAAGDWVVSAASWGAEKPVVSVGIISSTARTLAGTRYPPLLQCDLRSVQTSSGAALVDRSGTLLGVVVLTDARNNRQGWTYAIPIEHVKRLIKSLSTHQNKDDILILKRRRPIVGMVLDGNADKIAVVRVEKDGPAARAGIQVGDQILAADGVKIRSVYQAIRPVLYKQPGDTMKFTVQQKDQVRHLQVILGGGVALPATSLKKLSQYVQPKVDLSSSVNPFPSAVPAQPHQEVSLPEENPPTGDTSRTNEQKIQLLEKSLDRYRRVIVFQQGQLSKQQQEALKTDQQMEQLRRELARLKKEIQQLSPPAKEDLP